MADLPPDPSDVTPTPPRPEFSNPPYPSKDNPFLHKIIASAVTTFEEGQMSVAGAIGSAASISWAVGHAEGEDQCNGCTFRPVDFGPRKVPHGRCLRRSVDMVAKQIADHTELLARQIETGLTKMPQNSSELRMLFQQIQHAVSVLGMLGEALLHKK